LPRPLNIDSYCNGNHEKRDELGCPGWECNYSTQVIAESDRKRSHGSGAYDEKQNPAEKKGSQTPKAVSNVDVKAASFRLHGTQFAVGERSQKGKQSAKNPDEQCERYRLVDGSQHCARDQEDSGPNHGSDDEEDQIAQPQDSAQIRTAVADRTLALSCRFHRHV